MNDKKRGRAPKARTIQRVRTAMALLLVVILAGTTLQAQDYTVRYPDGGLYEQKRQDETVLLPFDRLASGAYNTSSAETIMFRTAEDLNATTSNTSNELLVVDLLDEDGMPLTAPFSFQSTMYNINTTTNTTDQPLIPVSATQYSLAGQTRYAVVGYYKGVIPNDYYRSWIMVFDNDLNYLFSDEFEIAAADIRITDITSIDSYFDPLNPAAMAQLAVVGRFHNGGNGTDFDESLLNGVGQANTFIMEIEDQGSSLSVTKSELFDFTVTIDENAASVPADIKEVAGVGYFIVGRIAASYTLSSADFEGAFYASTNYGLGNYTAYKAQDVSPASSMDLNAMQCMIDGNRAYIAGTLQGDVPQSAFFFDQVQGISSTNNQTAAWLFNNVTSSSWANLPYLAIPTGGGSAITSPGFTFVEHMSFDGTTPASDIQIAANLRECNIELAPGPSAPTSNATPSQFSINYANVAQGSWTGSPIPPLYIHPRWNGSATSQHQDFEKQYSSNLLPHQHSVKPIITPVNTDRLVQNSLGILFPGTAEKTILTKAENASNNCYTLIEGPSQGLLSITGVTLGGTFQTFGPPTVNTITNQTVTVNLAVQSCNGGANPMIPFKEDSAADPELNVWYAQGELKWIGELENIEKIELYDISGKRVAQIVEQDLFNYGYSLNNFSSGVYMVKVVKRAAHKAKLIKLMHH